ncbi:MAG TPA: nucleoside recognition protein [Methanosarcinales archaeon]|nr:nucleoside recognition protein [Methanosarcinales archaeon]
MIIGIILAELIVELKWVHKLGFISIPITRFAHLNTECGVSFLTAFGSPTAANSMLMQFYNSKLITKKELIIASMANSFPAMVMHWRALLPVLIPLIGVTGLIYFCMLMLVGFIKTFLVLIAGRLLLDKKEQTVNYKNLKNHPKTPLKHALASSVNNSKKTIKRILYTTIPITVMVFILINLGIFKILALYLSGAATYFPIPAEGLTIIATQFANNVAAYTVAGNLLSQGILNSKEIILTLLTGDVLSTVVSLRFLLPYYLGIYGPKIGTQIMILSTLLRLSVTVAVIIALALGW